MISQDSITYGMTWQKCLSNVYLSEQQVLYIPINKYLIIFVTKVDYFCSLFSLFGYQLKCITIIYS